MSAVQCRCKLSSNEPMSACASPRKSQSRRTDSDRIGGLRRLTRRRQEKVRVGKQSLPAHTLDRHLLPRAALKAARTREGRSRAFRERGREREARGPRVARSHRSAGMGVGLRAATAAAAVVGLLLLALNGGRLVSASGMLSTRPHEAGPGLSQGARLDQLEAGIAALRQMVGQQLPSMMEQRLGSALVEQRLQKAPRGFPTPRKRLDSSAQPPPPPPPPPAVRAFSNDRVLTPDDVLQRVPKGEMAFIALANQAYATLGINWALLLLPILERAGHPERAVLGARDLPLLPSPRSLCSHAPMIALCPQLQWISPLRPPSSHASCRRCVSALVEPTPPPPAATISDGSLVLSELMA